MRSATSTDYCWAWTKLPKYHILKISPSVIYTKLFAWWKGTKFKFLPATVPEGQCCIGLHQHECGATLGSSLSSIAGPGASLLGSSPCGLLQICHPIFGADMPYLLRSVNGLAQVMVVLQARWRSTAFGVSFSCRRACGTALHRHWTEVPSHARPHPPSTGKCYFSLVAPCLALGKLPPSLQGLGFMLGERKRTLWKSYQACFLNLGQVINYFKIIMPESQRWPKSLLKSQGFITAAKWRSS